MIRDIYDTDDVFDAADTLRFVRPSFDSEAPTDPDATSIYLLTPTARPDVRSARRRRRRIRDTRENVLRLREALANGWDIAPELAHEEQKLAAMMSKDLS